MIVRRATPADAEDAARVFTASFAGMKFVPKLHDADEDRAFVRGLIAGKEVWLAECDGSVIGLACWHDGWLEQLYVEPDHQGTGAGTALFEQIAATHPEGLQLWTFQANAGARRFYERNGCIAVEVTDGSRNEERTPDVRYIHRQEAPAADARGRESREVHRCAMTELVVCADAHFVWMLGGESPSPELRLPPGGIEAAPILEMLRGLLADIRKTHPVCAWLMVESGEVVGLCSLIGIADKDGIVRIGYGVAESRRRRGHATRTVKLMVDEILRDSKVRGITAETAVTNIASQRVLEEGGFVKTGTRRDDEDGEVFVWRYDNRRQNSAAS
jgi:RimJ/RimL family protein N-acetyltransferase